MHLIIQKKLSLAQDTSTCDYPKRERSVSALIFVFSRDQTDRLAFRLQMPCLHQSLISDCSEITHFYLSFFVSFVSILTVRMLSGKRVKKKRKSQTVLLLVGNWCGKFGTIRRAGLFLCWWESQKTQLPFGSLAYFDQISNISHQMLQPRSCYIQ